MKTNALVKGIVLENGKLENHLIQDLKKALEVNHSTVEVDFVVNNAIFSRKLKLRGLAIEGDILTILIRVIGLKMGTNCDFSFSSIGRAERFGGWSPWSSEVKAQALDWNLIHRRLGLADKIASSGKHFSVMLTKSNEVVLPLTFNVNQES